MEQLGQEDPKSFKRLIWAMALMARGLRGHELVISSLRPRPPPRRSRAAKARGNAPKPPSARGGRPRRSRRGPRSRRGLSPSGPCRGEGEFFVLENDVLHAGILEQGCGPHQGRAQEVPGEERAQRRPRVPAGRSSWASIPFAVTTGDKDFDGDGLEGIVPRGTIGRDGRGAKALKMSWADGKGNAVTKTFTLPPSGYELGLQVAGAQGRQGPRSRSPHLGPRPRPAPAVPGQGPLLPARLRRPLPGGGLQEGAARQGQGWGARPSNEVWGDKGSLEWAALTNNYFAAIFLPDAPFPRPP